MLVADKQAPYAFLLKEEDIMSVNIPRGTQDILPGQSEKWQYIESIAKDICRRYHYKEIRTPIFEHTELFKLNASAGRDSCSGPFIC
jgi:histidyl-tRNA synthetase